MAQAFRIGIAGLGTVGTGVVKLLQDNAEIIAARAGSSLEIVCVSARNKAKKRGVNLSKYDWVSDPQKMAERKDLDVVVELVGGAEGAALKLVKASLKNKKNVVSANKALIAHHGAELAKLAEDHGVSLNFEAAVAGGIPIIKTMREGLAGNQLKSVSGILNGTCNYILTEMRQTGRAFKDVLKDAQVKGYAEADPSFDIDGIDAAHKLCILTALAYGVEPDFKSLDISGIRHVSAQDIIYADELGYKIKLLGITRKVDGKIAQSVEPCLVPCDSTLGSVEGVFNAVFFEGDAVGRGMSEGRGAGAGPTASAVVSDLIDLARGVKSPTFGIPAKQLKKAKWAGPKDIVNGYYIHLRVLDRPGVIADVSAVLRDHKVSIEALIQRGRDPGQPVSVVLVTHDISQASVRAAVAKIGRLKAICQKPTLMRIEGV